MATHPTDNDYQQAAQILRDGGVIAYPTEAVFGLGCSPMNEAAVAKLLRLKQRDIKKGLLLIGASYEQLLPFVNESTVPLTALARAQTTWPGPITWIFPASARVPAWIRGEFDTVAIRHTDFAIARELCRVFGGALVSTSANIADKPPAKTAADVHELFPNQLDFILPGAVGTLAAPTEIRDVLTNRVVRPSPNSQKTIE